MPRLAQSQSTRVVSTLFLLFGLSLLSGCASLGGGSSNTPSSAVEVSPANANVRAGDTLQFSAKVSGVMDQSVVWSVNGTVGGDATVGKISTQGLYTSPAALPTPNSVTIEATCASNKSLSGSSAISLENPIPTVTAVSPTAVPVGNFTLTITGTKFVSGAKVIFGGQSLTTKFVSATELTATGTATTSQTGMSVQVTVANPDPGAMASAALMVKVGAIAITISPNTATLFPGQSVQLKATVTGATNQAVTWMVNGVVGGAANVGTISSTGLYTAPKTYTIGLSGVRITASSVDDPQAVSPVIVLALSNNSPVLNAVLPAPIPVGNFTVSATGSNFLNGAQILFNGTMLSTTFNSSTSLRASGTSSTAGTASIQVINPGSGNAVSNTLQVQVGNSTTGVTATAAARLLEQSTFGPTPY